MYLTGWHLLLRDLMRTVWDEIVAWTANLAERLPSRDQGNAGGAAGAVKQVQAISPRLPIAAPRRALCSARFGTVAI